MSIGNRLKELREAKGLTQEELSQALGWGEKRSRISNYENNKRAPSASVIEKFAKALETTPSYLQFGKIIETNFTKNNIKSIILPFLKLSQVDDWIDNSVMTASHRSVNMFVDISEVGEKSFLLEINGDALISVNDTPENIYPGEIALIDPELKPEINDFVLFDIDGEKKIRKLVLDGEQKLLCALNPKYPNITFDKKINFKGVLIFTYKKRKMKF